MRTALPAYAAGMVTELDFHAASHEVLEPEFVTPARE